MRKYKCDIREMREWWDLLEECTNRFQYGAHESYCMLKIEKDYYNRLNKFRYFAELLLAYILHKITKDDRLKIEVQKSIFYVRHRKKANEYVSYISLMIQESKEKEESNEESKDI